MTDSMVMEKKQEINPKYRALLIAFRRALIIMLEAVEECLEIEHRAIVPKRERA